MHNLKAFAKVAGISIDCSITDPSVHPLILFKNWQLRRLAAHQPIVTGVIYENEERDTYLLRATSLPDRPPISDVQAAAVHESLHNMLLEHGFDVFYSGFHRDRWALSIWQESEVRTPTETNISGELNSFDEFLSNCSKYILTLALTSGFNGGKDHGPYEQLIRELPGSFPEFTIGVIPGGAAYSWESKGAEPKGLVEPCLDFLIIPRDISSIDKLKDDLQRLISCAAHRLDQKRPYLLLVKDH